MKNTIIAIMAVFLVTVFTGCFNGNEIQLNYINDLLESRAQNAELLAALKNEIEQVCTDCLKKPSTMCNTCEGLCSRTRAMQAAIAKMEADK